jgi:hypothetical protein
VGHIGGSRWSAAGLTGLVLAGALLFAGCSGLERQAADRSSGPPGFEWGRPLDLGRSWAPAPHSEGGLSRTAEAAGQRLVIHTKGGDVDFLPGVNIGPTVPGRLPGEHGVEGADYRRWLPQIASLGLRSVRVYTILPPEFYRELARYNRAHPNAPLYFVQGVWIPEAEFYDSRDLFAPEVRAGFAAEIDDAVAAVHGDLVQPPRPGHASGTYTADVSPWLFAYSLGIEWDPQATHASDKANAGRLPYEGRYFSSVASATPSETWLAEMLDRCARAEAARGISMPLTFTNWPTADPLEHPEEPREIEDIVGIDANNIVADGSWTGGFFASYHAYPYYPDFLRHEPGLADFSYGGRSDPYAGYLDLLRRHYADLPLMITEFGVPSSLGTAHLGSLARDQGNHSEREQMEIDAELLGMIDQLDLAGAFVFEWADEWFKPTWNTVEYEIPGARRQLWRNPLTNEEHFGLVATEPGDAPAAVIDGDVGEWETNQSQVIYEGRRGVNVVRAVKDEAYLYLEIALERPEDLRRYGMSLGIDVLPGGNGGLPGAEGLARDADYAFTFTADRARAFVRASNDPEAIVYGKKHGYLRIREGDLRPGSGVWNLQRLMLNRPFDIPSTGDHLAVEEFDVGNLVAGTSDPSSPAFDSRTTWAATPAGIEVRIPYQMIGLADPSSRRALKVNPGGSLETVPVDRVGISVVLDGTEHRTNGYSWDIWNVVSWHERPKAGIELFARAVSATLPE